MTAPTKAEPLYERMLHAFGEKRIGDQLKHLTSTWGRGDPLRWLTDEARDVLLDRLIREHKLTRAINAKNRKLYKEKQNVI